MGCVWSFIGKLLLGSVVEQFDRSLIVRFESVAHFFEQLGGGMQIHHGVGYINMAHVGGQPGQTSIDVCSFLVPFQQTGDGERMTIMPSSGLCRVDCRRQREFSRFAEGSYVPAIETGWFYSA